MYILYLYNHIDGFFTLIKRMPDMILVSEIKSNYPEWHQRIYILHGVTPHRRSEEMSIRPRDRQGYEHCTYESRTSQFFKPSCVYTTWQSRSGTWPPARKGQCLQVRLRMLLWVARMICQRRHQAQSISWQRMRLKLLSVDLDVSSSRYFPPRSCIVVAVGLAQCPTTQGLQCGG